MNRTTSLPWSTTWSTLNTASRSCPHWRKMQSISQSLPLASILIKLISRLLFLCINAIKVNIPRIINLTTQVAQSKFWFQFSTVDGVEPKVFIINVFDERYSKEGKALLFLLLKDLKFQTLSFSRALLSNFRARKIFLQRRLCWFCRLEARSVPKGCDELLWCLHWHAAHWTPMWA